ncbi:MAG: prepilin-type N-terminal cleavage/methylation domain-containing protein [Deltaproteobacteria bacterium]|nr:prepilin-type N-terminal cleavage/methylation domain-containing protein [Deltaproteobacteria bacterium]
MMKTSGKKTDQFVLTNDKGFTLIEMAIVLIIIGIIIGAIVKGKDIIRSGEQKKIYSVFLNTWRTSYLNFYDRTGKILGDTNNDRHADTNPLHRNDPPSDNGREKLVSGDTARQPPRFYGLAQIGLETPKTNTDKPWKYRYSDSTGKGHEMSIAFDFDPRSKYNYMRISNIPNELCIAMDTMIDGEADGTKGDFTGEGARGSAWGTTPSDDAVARWKMDF